MTFSCIYNDISMHFNNYTSQFFTIKKSYTSVREMVQQLRALTSVPERLVTTSGITWQLPTICSPSSKESDVLLWPRGHCMRVVQSNIQAEHPNT